MVLDRLLHQYLHVSKDDSDIYLSNLRKSIKFAIINLYFYKKSAPQEADFKFCRMVLPWGIEPQPEEPESSILSIKLREHSHLQMRITHCLRVSCRCYNATLQTPQS